MAEVNLNVPQKPNEPTIKAGDYLTLDVSGDKAIQFKRLMSSNEQAILVDPAGYRFSRYDQDMVKWLAGQVVQAAFKSLKSGVLDATKVNDVKEINSSGYYYLSSDQKYLEAHMLDERNGVILILGTSFFYELNDGTLSDLKGGEKND